MDTRSERLGLNEVLFRQTNERIEQHADELGDSGPIAFYCECGDMDCVERIELSLRTYEAVRAFPDRFLVVPGHENPDVEHVVEERRPGHLVVEKVGAAAETAARHDPRS